MTKPVAALIACCKQKGSRPDNAIALYKSPLFVKSVAYAQYVGLPIYILSAKHGLILGNTIIAPYDVTLNSMDKEEKDQWARCVAVQIKARFNQGTLLCLAGENYLKFSNYCDNEIINPMRSLGIGQRLKWLNEHRKICR